MDYYQKALESWYKEGHPLRFDPLHPLLGMAGEAGELLNLYKKDKFKPNFNWFNCKHCGYGDASHYENRECHSSHLFIYTPLVLDELGDFWYYWRIVAWQEKWEIISDGRKLKKHPILKCLVKLNKFSVELLAQYENKKYVNPDILLKAFVWLEFTLISLDYSLDQLTELNYEKLNTADQNGWSSAR